MKSALFLYVVPVFSALLIAYGSASSQSGSGERDTHAATSSGNTASVTSMSGSFGAYGELYSIDGRDARRPSSTARMFIRPRLTFFESVILDFDFILSTEHSSSRQEINQFDINPKWSWGEIHAGDFAHTLSPLTLSGIKIRGGGVMLNPGRLRVSLLSGITKRSVSSPEQRSYRRIISAGAIGVGDANGSSVDLIVFTARDELSSLPDIDDSIMVDSSSFDTLMNAHAVTPQENLVVSVRSNIALVDRKLSFKNEISVCAITRDRRSSEIESEDIPGLVKNIFVPRVSSSADFALHSTAVFKLPQVSGDIGFEYTGPGYVSLGLSSLHNDQRKISANISYRYKLHSVKLSAILAEDNLINQKPYTTRRNRFGIMTTVRPVRAWSSVLYVNATTVNNSAGGTSSVDYSNWIIRCSQILTMGQSQHVRNAAIDYTLQKADEANPARRNSDLISHTVSIRSLIKAASGIDLTPSIKVIMLKQANMNQMTTTVYSLHARLLLLQRRLHNGAQVSLTNADDANAMRVDLKSSYQLGRNARISGEIGANFYRGGAEKGQFDECTFRASLVRSF